MTVTTKKKRKITSKSNPNGANQYMLDPRRLLFWELYLDSKSETFSNAYQTGMKVGYEESYSASITTTDWFLEKIRSMNLLGKAEKVLEDALELKHFDAKGKFHLDRLQTKLATAKFIASTKGKDEGYSTKSEVDVTSKGKRIAPAQVIMGMEIIREPKEAPEVPKETPI